MYNFLSKNGQLVAFLAGVVLVGIFLIMAVSGAGDYYFEQMEDSEIYQVGIFDFGIVAAVILTIICAVGMLLFGVFQIVSNFKNSMTGIIGVAVIAILMIVFFNISSGEVDHPQIERSIEKIVESGGEEPTSGVLKWIGSGLRMGILMSVLALLLMVIMPLISPIINRVK